VKILDGKNLPAADLNGYSDPYCKIYWGGHMAKTSVKKRTLNPYWNETFSLSSSNPYDEVKISVYDKDRFTRDDILGGGSVTTSNLINGVEKSATIYLTPRGEINLRIKAVNFPTSNSGSSSYTVNTTYNTGYGQSTPTYSVPIQTTSYPVPIQTTSYPSSTMTVDDMVRMRYQQTAPLTTGYQQTTMTSYNSGYGGMQQQPTNTGYPSYGTGMQPPPQQPTNTGYPVYGTGMQPPPTGYPSYGMQPPTNTGYNTGNVVPPTLSGPIQYNTGMQPPTNYGYNPQPPAPNYNTGYGMQPPTNQYPNYGY